jgi:hypothetical protein
MANGHGGYRQPASPAPVSGPGNLSQRTDGGPAAKQSVAKLPNAGYGEQSEFRGIQQGAPIQKVEPGAPSGVTSGPLPPPLDAPSGRPGEPVTHGADAGPGGGQGVLGLLDQDGLAQSDLKSLLRYLPTLQYIVDSTPDAPASTLALVRYLRSVA